MNIPLVTVITPTLGKDHLYKAIESVGSQTYSNIQHLVISDGVLISSEKIKYVDYISLPYNVGANGFNGHRIYGCATFLAKGDYICFLDDDNWFDDDHIQSMMDVIRSGNKWACSLRKIIDEDGSFVCNDDCESLGKWPSIFGSLFVDVNCYMLPKDIAILMAPVWYRKFRVKNQLEIDAAMMSFLLNLNLPYDSNRKYSVNYKVGNTELSVKKDFFIQGNQVMQKKLSGVLPWIRSFS